jgi:hypothetical protein
MTPYVLLLTSAEEVGGPVLVPIISIDFAVPLNEVTRIFLGTGQYLDVTEKFDDIVSMMGGLVMKPRRPVTWPERY